MCLLPLTQILILRKRLLNAPGGRQRLSCRISSPVSFDSKAASGSVRAYPASSATTRSGNMHMKRSLVRIWLLSGILHLSERLPYHQNYANETRRCKRHRCGRNSSLYKRAVSSRAAKPRNVRRNSYQSKDKNKLYIRYLYSGGGSGIRTMNLGRRTRLKSRAHSGVRGSREGLRKVRYRRLARLHPAVRQQPWQALVSPVQP